MLEGRFLPSFLSVRINYLLINYLLINYFDKVVVG